MKKYSYYLKLSGLNLNRAINALQANNIKLFDISRPSYKEFFFGVAYLNFYKVKKILKPYNVKIEKTYNLGSVANFFTKNLAIACGLVVSTVAGLFLSSITFKINILGTESISHSEIENELNSIGVAVGKITLISNGQIEQHLKQSIEDISLVSVIKLGTNIVINIKEKNTIEVASVDGIFAPYDMVINSIDVNQGTRQVNNGDVVKKGDLLVGPLVVIQNGEEVMLNPIASISGTSWINGSVTFAENYEEVYFTGKTITKTKFVVFGADIFSDNKQVTFENYEKKVYNIDMFNNLFLPITAVKEVYLETSTRSVTKSFEEEKQNLINQSKQIAYNNLPSGQVVKSEFTEVNKVNETYYITTYLEIDINIKV